MSDIAPAGTAPAKNPSARPAPITDRNLGQYVGVLVNKDVVRAGKQTNRKTGVEYTVKEDLYFITIARTGGRMKFRVPRQAHDDFQGNDVVAVMYVIAPSKVEGLVNVYVTAVDRVSKGDGKLPTAKTIAVRDLTSV